MSEKRLLAAVDLGSNSFHLAVMQEDNGRLLVVDKVREMVQLAFGLDDDKNLDPDVCARALECLSRFGERIKGVPKDSLRIVGTNTLRNLKNSQYFLSEAQKCLGAPIDVISGREEARLIYLGVSQNIESTENELLVMDIGGGSTEFIVGKGTSVRFAESLEMGCVHFSKLFFADGINKGQIKKAKLQAEYEIQPYIWRLAGNFRQITGASGSIKTILSLLLREEFETDLITLEGMEKLLAKMLDLKNPKAIAKYFDLEAERAQVITGGLVILMQAFESLGFESMKVADTGMREGIVLDLLGRNDTEDMRDRTISSLLVRFAADESHAKRVAGTSLILADLVKDSWNIGAKPIRFLNWAAHLHEIGLAVSHSQYHRHGAYLVANADLDGLSQQDQQIIAAIIRHHRRKIHLEAYEYLPCFTLSLTILLRLSVILHRSRADGPPGIIKISAANAHLKLIFKEGWLENRKLLVADLKNEARYLEQVDFDLSWE
ncbi:exopolyphosphatase [Gammaproteobacteria bacterium]|nr:exopolyphosphatase [Gammaproteobacteria bacterium]